MGCQSRDYKPSDGYNTLFYFSDGLKTDMCGIYTQYKGIVGGKKTKKRKRRSKKSRKYSQYTYGKKHKL